MYGSGEEEEGVKAAVAGTTALEIVDGPLDTVALTVKDDGVRV